MGSFSIKRMTAIGIVSTVLAILIRTFVLETFRIPSKAMIPTLKPGDIALVSKLEYGMRDPVSGTLMFEWGQIKQDHIVVFPLPDDQSRLFVKRVFATEGDQVLIQGSGEVSLFDKNQKIHPDQQRRILSLKKGQIFVVGDNPKEGTDSRHWGTVRTETVIGRVTQVISKGKIKSLSPSLLGQEVIIEKPTEP